MAWGDFTNPDAWKSAMANLLRRGGEVTDYIQQAPSKAGQAILDAGQRQQALMNEAFDPTGKTLIRNPQAANQAAMNLLEGPLGFMPAGITAWHGSPHTFEKFDMSKVGTGEGNQTFGHGMYFAEAPDVAKSYATMNHKNYFDQNKGVEQIASTYWDMYKTPDKAIQALKAEIKPNLTPEAKKFTEDAINVLESKKDKIGNLYKVDIPDEHIPMMLDWDKTISEQPKEVKDAMYKAIKTLPKIEGFNLKNWMDADPLASTWHNSIIRDLNVSSDNLSKLLNKEGVKGIRYLDNFSREKGGTSNFVVFDPTDVKILERNNQPLKNSLESVVEPIKEKGIDLDIYQSKNNPNNLILSKIAVPKEQRGSGLGTEAMNDLIKFADSQGKTIALTPDTVYGATSKGRLKDFYKRFGFVENTGKNKDFSISEGMYRLPTKESRQDQLLKAFEQNNK